MPAQRHTGLPQKGRRGTHAPVHQRLQGGGSSPMNRLTTQEGRGEGGGGITRTCTSASAGAEAAAVSNRLITQLSF